MKNPKKIETAEKQLERSEKRACKSVFSKKCSQWKRISWVTALSWLDVCLRRQRFPRSTPDFAWKKAKIMTENAARNSENSASLSLSTHWPAGVVRTWGKDNSLGLANPKVSQRTCKTREPNRKAAWNVSVSFWRFLQSHLCRVDARARPPTRKTRPLTHGARWLRFTLFSLTRRREKCVGAALAASERQPQLQPAPCLIYAFRHEFLCVCL